LTIEVEIKGKVVDELLLKVEIIVLLYLEVII
jgi:hypothetical protein